MYMYYARSLFGHDPPDRGSNLAILVRRLTWLYIFTPNNCSETGTALVQDMHLVITICIQ